MQEKAPRKTPSIIRIAIISSLLWTGTLASLLAWSVTSEIRQSTELATSQTRSFFQEFLMTRFWNTMHNGVYVLVSDETPPNPYLKDDPLRDLVTTSGIRLTKLNPAYMTRQISDITRERSTIVFHLTALQPINPINAPDPWEEKALRELIDSGERIAMTTNDQGEKIFRYISTLAIEPNCLGCHERYGDTLGSHRGGISISIPAQPLLVLRNRQIVNLGLSYLGIWLIGILAIGSCALRMNTHEKERSALIAQLQESLHEVKTLSGLLPICCSCKSIRDDKGYWKEVEKYMSEHADVKFTHGICPACTRKLYPELFGGTGQEPDRLSPRNSSG
ncbi:MAG: Tll0287-like domain-containing protein [Desulfobulbaceae bacterium]